MKQEKQINLSLYYHVMKIDFEVAYSMEKVNFLFIIFKFYNLVIKNIQSATYSNRRTVPIFRTDVIQFIKELFICFTILFRSAYIVYTNYERYMGWLSKF